MLLKLQIFFPVFVGVFGEMWLSQVEHGISSFHEDPPSYQIFRNVKDFGCKGDGLSDDTSCINSATSAGNRCGEGCGSSTLTPALVYFPPGKYLISSPVIMYYFTQIVGDANDPPTLLAASNFSGISLIDGDPYGRNGDNWYIKTKTFYIHLRNFVLDLRQAEVDEVYGIHWPMSQATTLYNVRFVMGDGGVQYGVFMEGGSGGYMANLTFEGGKVGMWIGNQQYLVKDVVFEGCDTAIFMSWGWNWIFKNIHISNSRIGIDISSASSAVSSSVGSVTLLDSALDGVQTGILTQNSALPTPEDTSNTILLDNVYVNNVFNVIADLSGNPLLKIGGSNKIASWGRGSLYLQSPTQDFRQEFLTGVEKSSNLLDQNGNFFTRSRPQYENLSIEDFASVKSFGALGDGKTDDSDAIQAAIDDSVGKKVVYFPAGSYIIGKTVNIVPGTKMIGEVWPVLMASGELFQNELNPQPMLKVGNPGERGSVEITEFLFSAKAGQPGAILVQWNLHEDSQGSAAMFDCHFRVGGSQGSDLQYSNCPRGSSPTFDCFGVHTMLHLTPSSSAYVENTWAWTTNYDMDDHVEVRQVSVYTGRGVLIQSEEGPVWLYATESEHNVLYQYQLDHTKNIFITLVQSETPYYQPAPRPPSPFTPNPDFNDPTYEHCREDDLRCTMSYALRVVDSSKIFVYGAGMYNFFMDYETTCGDRGDCQNAMVDFERSTDVYLFNVNTRSSVYMVVVNNTEVLADSRDNVNDFCRTVNVITV